MKGKPEKMIARLAAAAAGGVLVTTGLFLLIPLMNRSVFSAPEQKKPSRIYTLIQKTRKPLKARKIEGPDRARPKTPPPPKPLPPRLKYRPSPRLDTRLGSPTAPLRLDPSLGLSLGSGGIPLYIPPERAPERGVERSEGRGPVPEKRSSFLPHEIDSPPKVLRRITAVYPPSAYRRGIEGFALLRFVVDARGRVSDIRVVDWEGTERFGEAAMEALGKWTFTPGLKKGRAVSVRCQLRFFFREED
jgi:protein TonB